MSVQYGCKCGHTQPVMQITARDEQKLREIVEPFLRSGDTAELNPLFDTYEPLLTSEKDSGLRLNEWNKLKADIRGLAIAIRTHRMGS